MNKKHHQEWRNATNLTQFEYCCGNFEFSSSINKGATIRLPGGGGGLGLKKQSGPGFGKAKMLALTMCEKNILTPSIDKKCLPSIHEKQMSALYP